MNLYVKENLSYTTKEYLALHTLQKSWYDSICRRSFFFIHKKRFWLKILSGINHARFFRSK